MSSSPETDGTNSESVDSASGVVEETVAPAESLKPGAVLKRTREAQGHSIADVVQVIRFSVRQIEAMERDDYAVLPGPIAARGLVRNYAKFLRLDATPLLAQLDPAVPAPEADVRPPANMGEAEQPTIVEQVPARFVAVGAMALILALAAYWYSNFRDVDGGLAYLLGGASDSSVSAPSTSAVLPAVPVAAVEVAPAANPQAAETPPLAAGVETSSTPFAGLRVEFDDLSWIEIRDATQKIVFVGEYPAGTRQNVEGKAPFQVWIGKASGVRVFMGERSIDLKPHTREEIARFTLE